MRINALGCRANPLDGSRACFGGGTATVFASGNDAPRSDIVVYLYRNSKQVTAKACNGHTKIDVLTGNAARKCRRVVQF